MIMVMSLNGVSCFERGNYEMTEKEQIALAARLLHLTEEETANYVSCPEGVPAIYISVPVKGGDSLLVGVDGSVLYANSSVRYEDHIEEFKKGRRTPIEAFS